jgi:hypothetical protein
VEDVASGSAGEVDEGIYGGGEGGAEKVDGGRWARWRPPEVVELEGEMEAVSGGTWRWRRW